MKVRPVARICSRGVTWKCDLYVCLHKHARLGGSGGSLASQTLSAQRRSLSVSVPILKAIGAVERKESGLRG